MVLIVRLNRVISGSISLAWIKTFLLKSPMATAVTMAPISRSAFWKAKLAKHVSRVNAYVRLQSLPC